MISLVTQDVWGHVCFLTEDYFLNRPGTHDHMLIIANCRNLDHLNCADWD
ncbi:peptidase [Enterobacteriaceae bacterium 89]|nr:peptidase [Enterobacteriaceae bacterium 89]